MDPPTSRDGDHPLLDRSESVGERIARLEGRQREILEKLVAMQAELTACGEELQRLKAWCANGSVSQLGDRAPAEGCKTRACPTETSPGLDVAGSSSGKMQGVASDGGGPTTDASSSRPPQVVEDPRMPVFIDVGQLWSCTWSGIRVQPSAISEEASGPVDPPPGLEQEDAGRGKHEKRQEIIQCIKLKPSYKEYELVLQRGEELPCEVPGTPDPADETISKRQWEKLVSKWRAALRQVEKIRNGVTDEN